MLDSASPSGSFTVQQSGPGGAIALTLTGCHADVAGLEVSPTTVAIGQSSPTRISVTAYGHGHSEPKGDCTIAITGGGGMATTMNVTVDKHGGGGEGGDAKRRKPLGTPPEPAMPVKPDSAPPTGVPHPVPAAGPGPAGRPEPGPGPGGSPHH